MHFGFKVSCGHGSPRSASFERFRSVSTPDPGRMEDSRLEAHTVSTMIVRSLSVVQISGVQVRDQHAYCNMVEEELDDEPWFHDIREYIRSEVYLVQATGDQKRTIQCLASGSFFNGGVCKNELQILDC
ncbi:uncharacterized protein [Nicotiana sylvestris]|uniref:uncharacterized protein n=1 Tax=Nicotiana sylvestris TaxID=4096 RepID=UPI00388C667C